MKRKGDYILRDIAGDSILIPIGQEVANFNGVITLNESAVYLWEQLKEEKSKEDLVCSLIKEYEIGRELAEKDVDNFIDTIETHNMIESD